MSMDLPTLLPHHHRPHNDHQNHHSHHHHNHSQSQSQSQNQNQNQPRYVSVPNSSRPHYPDDPNFQNPRLQRNHHALQTTPPQPPPPPLPPPPLTSHILPFHPRPPPQQPSPYRPPPPVQGHSHAYNPVQSQFAFANPSYDRDDDRSRSSYPLREFGPSPKVSHRLPVEDDRPRHRLPEFAAESRQEFWEQPRVLAENNLPESGSQKFQFDHNALSPYKASNRVRHESESSSRFRVDYADVYESKHREEVLRVREDENFGRRGNVLSNPGTSFRDVGFVSNSSLSSRNSESESENYHGNRYGSVYDKESFRSGRRDVVYENQRWGHERKVPRDAHNSSFERGSGEISNGDGAHFVPAKRYNNRGTREDVHEFNRTPRKQMQKKSAFLRIQKPNHRNSESEQSHYSGYVDNSNSSSFRRRDHHHAYMGSSVNEEGRVGSPVELDISFKDNSLVAKAILAPMSCSDVTDADLTLGNVKGVKDSVADGDCSNAELTKLGDNIVNVDSSMQLANNAPSSDKKMLKSEVKVTSDIKEMHDANSQACSSATNHSHEKNKVQKSLKGADLDKDGTAAGPNKPSLKVVKKKKLVKKKVKKVVRTQSQQKKQGETVIADARVPTPSGPSETDKVVASSSYPCPSETNTLHVGKMVEGSSLSTESKEHGNNESRTKCESDIEKKGNNLNTCLGSLSLEEIKIDKYPENTEYSAQGLRAISNNKGLVKSLETSTSGGVVNAVDVKQSCQIGDSMLLDNELDKNSSPITLPLVEKVDSALLNSENTKMHDNLMSTYCSANGTDTTLDILDGTKLSKEENPVREEISKALLSTRSSATVGLSCSGEATSDAHSSDHDSDRVTSLGDYNVSNHELNITVSRSGTVDCVIKQPSTDGSSGLPENSAKGRPRKTKISVGNNKGDTPMSRKKRTIRSQSNRTTNIDLDSANVSDAATAVDTKISLSFEDPSREEAAVSSMGSLDDGLQPGKDWTCELHDGSSVRSPEANLISRGGGNDGFHVTPIQSIKRRKVSTSHLPVPSPQTGEQPADTSASVFCAEAPATSNDVSAQQHMELFTSSKEPVGAATDLMNSENENTVLHENRLSQGCSNAVGVTTSFNDEEKKGDGAGLAVNDHGIEVSNVQSRGEQKVAVPASKEQVLAQDETPQDTISSGIQPSDIGKSFSFTDMESDNLLVKDDFPNLPNDLSSPKDHSGAASVDEAMDFVPDLLTVPSSPQTSFDVSDVHMSDVSSISQLSNQTCRENEKIDQKSLDDSAQKSFSECAKSSLTSDSAAESDQAVEGKISSLRLQDSRSMSQGLTITSVESKGMKNQLGYAVSSTFPGRSSFGPTTSKKRANSTQANPRTWHRNVKSSASPLPASKASSKNVPFRKQLPERDGKVQSTSYVRQGNSLVRKPSPVAALPQGSPSPSVFRLKSVGSDESKRSIESDTRVGIGNSPCLSRLGEKRASCENPRSSPIQSGDKLPNDVAISSGDCTSSPSTDPLSNGCCETNSYPISSYETNDTPKLVEGSPTSEASENQNDQLDSVDSQTELNNGNLASLNMKQIVYVKRKSNQLVATSNSVFLSVANADKSQTSSFDGYYKRRKNQLIRTSLESHSKQPVNDNLNSGVQLTLDAISRRRLSKRRLLKVVPKTFKRSTNSLVWTLYSTQSTKVNSGLLYHQKVLPHLFPWKRTTYWRSFMQNTNLVYKSSSLAISKKLLLSRKRDTVYTRSMNGFSLRKSKVLSVGGASLKWSKSIEKHSKKANEEATLAVAAVEKKKREQKGATCISSGSKNRNHSSRERIFRIGSSRYKMDPSRRTLQRISDDESSCAASAHPEKDAKRSYIPRRLVIGNDEYIRIGNGNQLIRDPKKRTRILASEKVRWSLHTARLRLARKRKYCQFFTRFGKCNKDSGKCPYIHDPSKIAVCTKFLNGLCSNANCKLTHKVIPERMPDCSYFLQGLCNNQNCPYRHVNVNPKASTCEGFLRGYCADGNECRKKHSYICPAFEATGTCPQGSKCKLHHPKSRMHGKKRKRSREQKNARGRYFGSPDILESRTMVFEKHFAQDGNNVFLEGNSADFIAIDAGDDDLASECNDSRNEQPEFCESDTSERQIEDLDESIKPLRLMDTSLTA